MISTPNIDRYDDVRLGNLVIMLALDGVWPKVMPMAGLRLSDSKPLIALCRTATEAAPPAHYDDAEFEGWVRWPHLVGAAFRASTFEALSASDRATFYDWLENGMAGPHEFPHRLFWYKACVWAWRRDDVSELLTGEELNTVQEFAADVAETVRADDYKAAVDEVCENRDSFSDTYLKTKFHINLLPDVLIRPQLIDIGFMRRAHILRKKTETFLSEGGDPELLERMTMLYAEHNEKSKYLVDYVTDHASFRVPNLWSNRFLGAEV